MSRKEVLDEIKAIANEDGLTFREAAEEMLYEYYDAAGFGGEELNTQICQMDTETLINTIVEEYSY